MEHSNLKTYNYTHQLQGGVAIWRAVCLQSLAACQLRGSPSLAMLLGKSTFESLISPQVYREVTAI